MRSRITVGLFGLTLLVGLAACESASTGEVDIPEARSSGRLNPMIALHEAGLPVLGITHPAVTAGRGGRGGPGAQDGQAPTTPPQPVLSEVARETLDYQLADFQYASGVSDAFLNYVDELIKAGGTARTHAFIAKTLVYHRNPESATQRIHSQLDAGHVGVMTEEVESRAELEQVISAMRFASKGGTRPETGLERAAAYWGMGVDEYKEKADVWPLNPDGELIVWAIVESREGVANVREIAATPGLGVMWAGAGTLGGVYSSTNDAGERVRDQEGFDQAVAAILSACKEFNVPCGYPASNADDVERLLADGWSVLVMQSRNDNGFAAIEAGRRLSGRPLTP